MNSSHTLSLASLRAIASAAALCAAVISLPALAQATSTPADNTPPAAEATPAAAPAAAAPQSNARIGTFKRVNGDVQVGQGENMRKPAPGDGVDLRERLVTGKDGAASIMLKDGTVLTMGPETTMDLSQYAFDGTTQKGNFLLDLVKGSVRVVTGLLGKANPDLFKVSTPTSVVGVRGTDFIVETQEQ